MGRISLRTSSRKLRSSPPNPGKQKHFGTDIPRGRPWKNFSLKNFGLIFRFLDFGFSAGRQFFLGYFPEVPVTKCRVSAPAPYNNPTVNCDRRALWSDSVKRHLSRRHLSALKFKFDFIFNGGCTREEQIALSLKRHLFLHGSRKPKAFWIYFSTLPPILNIFSNFSSSALKRHLLKRHLTLSDLGLRSRPPLTGVPRGPGRKVPHRVSRAAKRGCFKRGGFPIWTCPSVFVLFCPFGTFPGIFPICSGMVRGFSRFVLFLFSAY